MSMIHLSNAGDGEIPFFLTVDKDKDFLTMMRLLRGIDLLHGASSDEKPFTIRNSSVIQRRQMPDGSSMEELPFTPNVMRTEVHAAIAELLPHPIGDTLRSDLERAFPESDWGNVYPLQTSCQKVLDALRQEDAQ